MTVIPISVIKKYRQDLDQETKRAADDYARGTDLQDALLVWNVRFQSYANTIKTINYIKSKAAGFCIVQPGDKVIAVEDYDLAEYITEQFGIDEIQALDADEFKVALAQYLEWKEKDEERLLGVLDCRRLKACPGAP